MRKIKVLSISLLLISILAFAGYAYYAKVTSDNQGPVLRCESEELTVSVAATEEELLQGVTAEDDRSGDVTDTVVVESISAFAEEGNRVITYAAIDEKGNVGRIQRVLKYTDYTAPTFDLTAPLRFPTGSSVDILKYVTAHSSLDGDLSNSVKYSLESTIDLRNKGVYPVVFRVTDSGGNVEYLSLELEVYDRTEEKIDVVLSKYLIYLPLNAAFNPQTYFVGSDIDGDLVVQSNVDVTKEGVYTVDYVVNGKNSIGKSRLVVVVTGS